MSTPAQIVKVAGGNHPPYEIFIGAGLLPQTAEAIASTLGQLPSRLHLVSDNQVAPLHLAPVENALRGAGAEVFTHIIAPGEGEKSWDGLKSLTDKILSQGIARDDCLVALGGGVVGDLTGLAGALLLRGVPVVQVPTSLLAQVDSSVGGKTAIDTRQGKNLIGAFYPPRLVLCDTSTIASLPVREVRCGLAEIIKYGLALDAEFFAWLTSNAQTLLQPNAPAYDAVLIEAVKRSCQHKARVVADDPLDTKGRRALLNLGHTFAHAFEATLGYDGDTLKHGEAVGLGLVLAARLSEALEMTAGVAEAITQLNQQLGLATHLRDIGLNENAHEQIIEAMGYDKKIRKPRDALCLVARAGAGGFPVPS